eukprot:CAMPEP_0179030956 /NCGR_PEP_ID=MMETSP0796-20121207/10826_1 /TAXON_ID=73915 /ORGANISM="Pyrodinium bahamense, Strain pbaha01" /LENGTH=180 /DNA_ID=CAMNT_0020727141 /DNA_START=71 /DNA_END=609 /DNA_ORIENTATION=-
MCPTIHFRGQAEMIVTDPHLFVLDPNVEAAAAEALASLVLLPSECVATVLSRIPHVSKLPTHVAWELATAQHLASRGAILAEYVVATPTGMNSSSAPGLLGMTTRIADLTVEALTSATRRAVADRAGTWTYIVTVDTALVGADGVFGLPASPSLCSLDCDSGDADIDGAGAALRSRLRLP